MANDEDHFRIRPGRVRDRAGGRTTRAVRPRPKTFLAEVHQAIRRAGGDPNRLGSAGKGSGRFNARGRGAAAAAGLKGRSAWSRNASGVRTRARRVTVKARIVKLNPQRGAARGRSFVSAKAVDAHLRYLERDGVNRHGEKGQVYSAERDAVDGSTFLDRGRDDRHQFRFIVSAEEGVELADLRETTRDLMKTMEADLGTRLDWIAVDHHNTGHPHTHILLRGVTDDGKILNIAGDYIAHGIRERASEIVTLERQEIDRVGKEMAAEHGLTYSPSQPGEYVSGRLAGVANLASGRFAMIEDGLGFQLVPWQPVLEKRLDQHISGVRRDDGGIEWSFSRKRQIGLGL
jgi:hypothetical protein